MTPEEWVVKGRTGISSMTIWAVLMGVVSGPMRCGFIGDERYDVPQDPSDFGRCHALLEAIPGWRERLHEVPTVFPKWGPMVREWPTLEALWEEESPEGSAPRLYDKMRLLVDEGMLLDGWRQDGPGSWTRK